MSVRKLKPVTPAQRFRIVNGFDMLTTDRPEKSLLTSEKALNSIPDFSARSNSVGTSLRILVEL